MVEEYHLKNVYLWLNWRTVEAKIAHTFVLLLSRRLHFCKKNSSGLDRFAKNSIFRDSTAHASKRIL